MTAGSVLVSAMMCSLPALAEVLPLNSLGRIGSTDLQIRTGNAVQAVCGQFIAANEANTPPANELEEDLFDKCGEMVHTARVITGDEGATAKSLDLTEEELQGALQNVAGEEAAASGSMATESSVGQVSNISKRISALLSRSSTMQLSAVNIFGNDALYTLSDEELLSLSGGAAQAGDDQLLANRWGVFINGDIGSGEKDATDGEDGFSYDSAGFTVGVDYRLSDQTVLGLAAGFTSSESDFDRSSTVSGGGLDTETTNLSAYGLFYTDDYFFDFVLTAGQGSFDMERRIRIQSNSANAENDGADRTATSDTDSTQFAASFGGGTEIISGSLTFAPYARLQYLQTDVDAFEETGAGGLNLGVEKQEIESLTSALGFRASTVANASFGVLIPQGRLEWIHEFSDDEREISTVYVNDPRQNELLAVTDGPDRDYFSMGLGLSAVFKGGTQAFVDLRTLMGMSDFTETVVTAGIRFEL
ncbi:MAG: autotransporter outer membrane beta-barrel domain-containing protein [Gammaproteobacteria bacterium]|nr:autotransporter outer membrane beta-barrel domain-containing protein [Gammaproteobacteria bacterium]